MIFKYFKKNFKTSATIATLANKSFGIRRTKIQDLLFESNVIFTFLPQISSKLLRTFSLKIFAISYFMDSLKFFQNHFIF